MWWLGSAKVQEDRSRGIGRASQPSGELPGLELPGPKGAGQAGRSVPRVRILGASKGRGDQIDYRRTCFRGSREF